jgi:iron complex outermembrane receptor protein
MKPYIAAAILLSTFLSQGNLLAEEALQKDEELLFFEQEAYQLSIATKHLQTVWEAPAIATVITEQEIRNMGARDMLDILRRVPGFGTTIGPYGMSAFEIRGIKGFNSSERILFLIDGIPANEMVRGGLATAIMQISVDNIKRIEIIRGPGSALHGSGAFSGVINVVTKQGDEINGVAVSGGRGSFDTVQLDLQAGRRWADLDVAFFLDYYRTDGAALEIPLDAFGNSGVTDFRIDRLDAGLKIGYKELTLNTRLIRLDRGPYLGALLAVNDESDLDTWFVVSELAYRHRFGQNGNLSARTYLNQGMENFYWELLPEGTGPFTDGMIGNPSGEEHMRGLEAQFDYRAAEAHLLTVGAVVEQIDVYDTKHIANFDPLTGAPIGPVQDITDGGNYIREETRKIWAVYLQDDWSLTDEVNLVFGVRHDRYSDFGATTNPRVAAVWQFAQGWDAKLMYGTAFIAPTLSALYYINNPAQVGNPNLDPEKMRTYEASVGYIAGGTEGRISYFHNDFDDKIQPLFQPPGLFVFGNRGGATVQGVEVEAKRRVGFAGEVYANYTYQKTEDAETHREIPDVAAHKGNVGVDFSPVKYLNVNANLFMIGKKPRALGDPRKDSPGYALLDLTLIARELYKGLEIRGSVHNLLDKEYADPLPAVVPGDLPREGRHLMVEALYRF